MARARKRGRPRTLPNTAANNRRRRGINAASKRYALTPEGRVKGLFFRARYRARKRGLEFTITLDHIIIPSHCPLLKIPILIDGTSKDNSPSLDRIDSSKGYTPDNVWVISWRANAIKSNATLEEFTTITENWRIALA